MSKPRVPEDGSVLRFPRVADPGAAEREEENEWMLRIKRAGDRVAFTCLFERLAPRINNHLRLQGVSAADAENALQDIWLVVWRKAEQFDPSLASARTWIYTLVRNRLIDLDRASRREFRMTERYVTQATDQVYEQDLLAQALGGRIARVLAQLPEAQRSILIQCYVEGKSQREIASEQRLPIGTVKSRARLAFERVKILLAGNA